MLNFDEDRYLRIQGGALDQAQGLHEAIGDCMKKGMENLFFAGAGGVGHLMYPAAFLLRHRSRLPVFLEMPAELQVNGSVHLGPKSVVVLPSLSGTTKESVDILDYCQDKGATVLTMVGHADTPLGRNGDHVFVNFAEDDTSCESFYLQSLLLALSVMNHRGECPEYARMVDELKTLPPLLVGVKREFEARAEAFAEAIRDETYLMFVGAGGTWAEAFYYGMCILEEMQWIRTRPVHAADFFHGPLELVEKGVSVILMKGEDASRPLVERVEAFVPTYSDKLAVFDTADFALPSISPDVRAMISPVLLAAAFERLSAHLEVKRDHPLTTRRYYKRVAY